MIPKKYTPFVFSFFMSLLMSGIISLVISIFNLGLAYHTLHIWLKSWGIAFVIAYPTIIAVSPVVRKLVNLVVDD